MRRSATSLRFALAGLVALLLCNLPAEAGSVAGPMSGSATVWPHQSIYVDVSFAAGQALAALGSKPIHVEGDMFKAKPRPDVPEREKPTPAQQRARRANIKEAQAARHA